MLMKNGFVDSWKVQRMWAFVIYDKKKESSSSLEIDLA